MAGPTRFELATSCVTGRRSNQLNYDPAEEVYAINCRTIGNALGILAIRRRLQIKNGRHHGQPDADD